MSIRFNPVETLRVFQRQQRIAVLMSEYGGRCCHCGRHVRVLRLRNGPFPRDQATEDHIITKMQGGTDALTNVALACRGCNEERGLLPFEWFRETKRAERVRRGGRA